MADLERDSPPPTRDTAYECDKCGACCEGSLLVEADWVDAVREPRLLAADANLRALSLGDLQEGRIVLLTGNRPCPFLGDECMCSIYPTRRQDCVAFEAGSDQCQEARQHSGLPLLMPLSDRGKEDRHVG